MIKIFIFFLCAIMLIAFCIIVVLVLAIKEADHHEMLTLAVADYMKDSYNFDISHYPSVTMEEVEIQIKRIAREQKNELKDNFNDNPDTFFDEL